MQICNIEGMATAVNQIPTRGRGQLQRNLVVHVSARTVRPARGRLGRRRAGLIARIVGAEIAAARYRLPIPFAMITCPERTSGIRHEPFCCAVAVRPQQDTSPDRDSRLRTADDGHRPQARSQERRLSSIGPPAQSGESGPCHDSGHSPKSTPRRSSRTSLPLTARSQGMAYIRFA